MKSTELRAANDRECNVFSEVWRILEHRKMKMGNSGHAGWIALAILAVTLPGTASQQHVANAKNESMAIERGKYLVDAVAICFECHSERDFSKPGWPIPRGRAGGGRILWGEGTPDQVVAPNISPDKATGIGTWTDREIIRAIRDGVGRKGRPLNPEMPSRYFRQLSDTDLASIVAYLRSIPSVHRRLPKMKPYVPGKSTPTIAMDTLQLKRTSDRVKLGEYLVRLGGCETCHTPTNTSGYIKGLEFAGGTVFRHDEQAAASSNLTPDPSGISYYDERRFLEVIRTGRVGARPLLSAMPWWFYRNMTEQDLKAVFAYLQALPPVQHRIDNGANPTLCRKCGNQHGLGNEN
jgi:mono/diheme cytochrome c family protein